jgi:transcriptional regulator with XRE-family HTH domain
MKKAENYSSKLIDDLLNEISPEELERTKEKMMLAARIDEAKKAKGWKNKDLAKALNKRPSEITKWLSGTHNFTADTLFDIGKILNIELINLSNKKPEQVTNYFIFVSQKTDKESDVNVLLNDPDELISNFSTSYKTWTN